jgi:hypothetical protein
MSARNWTFTQKSTAVGKSATTAPMPVPGPGSSPVMLVDVAHGVAPRLEAVRRISIGTLYGPAEPGPGLVQLEVPAQVAVVPLMPLNVRVWRAPSRPAAGSAVESGPQYSAVHDDGLKPEKQASVPPESPGLAAPDVM